MADVVASPAAAAEGGEGAQDLTAMVQNLLQKMVSV